MFFGYKLKIKVEFSRTFSYMFGYKLKMKVDFKNNFFPVCLVTNSK
jgi:hypothetical protein